MDGSFIDILDHVENFLFSPYASPQCNGGTLHRKNVYWKGGTPHTLCWSERERGLILDAGPHWQRGRHCTEKMYTGRGGHRTYFVDGGNSLGWGHRTILKEQAETFQNLNFP